MSVKQSEEKIHLSNIDQVASALPLISSPTVGLEFLRTINQLYVSQHPSLSEGNSFETNFNEFTIPFCFCVYHSSYIWYCI
jgi:hypothetical protein